MFNFSLSCRLPLFKKWQSDNVKSLFRIIIVVFVFSGGFKEWECGTDLARFICEQNIDFTGKHVIEVR